MPLARASQKRHRRAPLPGLLLLLSASVLCLSSVPSAFFAPVKDPEAIADAPTKKLGNSWKSTLHGVLGMRLERLPVKGEDYVYTVEEETSAAEAEGAAPTSVFTATITLPESLRADAKLEAHAGPLVFKGDPSSSQHEAETSAAEKASEALFFERVKPKKAAEPVKKPKKAAEPVKKPKKAAKYVKKPKKAAKSETRTKIGNSWKSTLHGFLGMRLERLPVKGEDYVYTLEEETSAAEAEGASPTSVFTATITLPESLRADAKLEAHDGPLVFKGDPSSSQNEAETSAAEKASKALFFDRVNPKTAQSEKKPKKAAKSETRTKIGNSWKSTLHGVLGMRLKRLPVKGEDYVYTVEEETSAAEAEGASPTSVFTATITLPESLRVDAKLEAHDGPLVFKGDPSSSQNDAESSAAEKASVALSAC